MDELSKLKKSRGVLRTSITKYLNKIEADFKENLDSFTVTILEESLIYLKEIEKQLKDSDNEIQKLIENEQDFDSEIEAAIEYNQKIIICSSKVAAQLKIIQNKVDPQVIASHISSLRINENATTNEQNNTLGSSTIAFDALGNRNNSVKTIKLPKLAIDKYYGDPCSWLEFWNRFQNSIDNNTALSKVDKFSYLKGLLGGSAANAINGFALSDENYDQALNLLKQRFGREELVINAHMAKLLNLLPVNDSNNIYGLRKLYDTVEVQIRSLESLKVTSGMFGHLLYPILIKLIPEDLALAFHRKRKRIFVCLSFGARQAKEQSYNVVRLKLENRDEPSLHIEIEALETEQISATTLPVPETNISKTFNKLKGLQLADRVENKDKNISILIGVDYYYEIVSGRLKRLNDKLVATETIFSWCLQGYIGLTNDLLSLKIVVDERNISDQLQQFWKLENLGVGSESQEEHSFDADIMKEFEAGITYQDNRYKVKFPWKSNMKHLLNNNRDIASRRFSKLKSNFINDPSLFSDYKKVIDEHLRESIIERIKDSDENKENTYYLPHRAVIRKDHSTTRLRIVFDASSHAKGQLSLNDCLYTGLNLIPDLFSLLLRFRSHPVAITADIQKAFLQINIDEEDRNFTRFYWSNNPEDGNEEIYRMTRVLFGVCSSPFLLAATIKYHLKRYVEQFPMTCELLENSLYVDDLITGREDIESAFKTSLEAFNIFKDASMNLRKWKTNSVELRDRWRKEGLEIDDSNYSVNDNSTLTPCKVLGLSWDSDLDIFYFDAQNLEKFLSRRINTKRYILQVAGRIFDPLGILGPFTIKIKCMIQEIWCLGLDWDDPIPKQLTTAMNEWCEDIKDLHLINIPRYYLADAKLNEVDDVQLHCFSDASKKAYGAVVYIRVVFKNGRIISNFVASKSRVAPLKTLSMPRLELMGALLAARLNSKISKYLNFPVTQYFWTDSSIVYYWIKGDPERFKIFVKNRVKEIQNLSDPCEWLHTPGTDNPADIISRGLTINELKSSKIWWQGPSWLIENKNNWPEFSKPNDHSNVTKNKENLELKKSVVIKLRYQKIK
ncbi:hypothetical protein AVEN_206495-1 [Araneus ventricosus]|uniref:Reverse transcriptase domain-containing protein n=1 Tax=Araneus ventricosus TaxID=182803 RepID=A0A4Y2D2Z9_ARAVE|nr:hypothetical protein AVEN_76445-1 [Araneus ventricosus]GBM11103.1 hypothetical protein AVEN_125916-1 [Araneus ventricosus]GBM11111.1 hypothetical protein AVEN_145007-1 [Araneus ventricosus]GBM11142.1 hypothetical protein AVEN_206495-1 [Araneus ventricosus]